MLTTHQEEHEGHEENGSSIPLRVLRGGENPSDSRDRRVVVTGVGPVSAIGIGREAFFAALVAGRSGIGPASGGAGLAAEVRDFDVREYLETEKAYLDRASQLTFAAMSLALEDANLDLKSMDRAGIGLILGSSAGCLESSQLFFADYLEKGPRFVKPIVFPHTYTNMTISLLAIEYGLSGYHLSLTSGATASAVALVQAYDLVRTGRCSLVLAGGFEALSPLLRRGYELMGRVSPRDGGGTEGCAPFDAARNGFVLGEGAGILVLEDADHAEQRGATVLGELLGGSLGSDGSLCGRAGAAPGQGLARVMRRACEQMPRVDYISAAANGGPLTDRIEAVALYEFLGTDAATVPVSSIKPMIGETLGADGALRTIAALGALRSGFLPPTLNLKQPESGWGLNLLRDNGLARPIARVLVNSIDPGGSVVCLALGGPKSQVPGGR